jgi:hypothetical protein
MKNIIIIGAGQLGSRHLQGILKYTKVPLSIYVSDPSEAALQTSRERADEIEHPHTLYFINNSSQFPSTAALAIVATNSNVREFVTRDLLEKTTLQYLDLEKVLFQEIAAYDRIQDCISKYPVKVFVNHPRRLTPSYIEVAAQIEATGGRSFFSIAGENWDLGCNALHMIDLFTFLSHSKLKSISTAGIDTVLLASKREGYVEFTGSLSGLMENNDAFSISSFPGVRGPLTVQVATNGHRWLVQEGGTKTFLHFDGANNYAVSQNDFFQDFQSNLTTQVLSSLLENDTCALPTYEEAAHSHKIFITALLEKYNTLTNLNELKCPIT